MEEKTETKGLVYSAQERSIPTCDGVEGADKPLWTAWEEERPTDTTALYRWRIPARKVCGAVLRPEWTEKLTLVGMGYSDNEWWPLSPSHWNGYVRTVPAGLEWRLANEGEKDPVWEGLALAPDPWTGLPPVVRTKTRWIAAPCYEAEGFWLEHRFGSTGTWSDVTRLANAWNSRTPTLAGYAEGVNQKDFPMTDTKLTAGPDEWAENNDRVKCGNCRFFVRNGNCGFLATPKGQNRERPFTYAPFWVWSDCYSDKEQVRADVESCCSTFLSRANPTPKEPDQ